MFTGLIEDVGTLKEVTTTGDSSRVVIASGLPLAEIRLGDSIAVDGICLTVTGFGSATFSADASPETLSRSTLGARPAGAPVNLERALRLGDRLGGHLVTGHVDGTAVLADRRRAGNAEEFIFRLDPRLNRLLVEKGSVAVDGISLTVNRVGEDTFALTVIPHTLARTTLRLRRPGERVNIETDLLGKYVERLLGLPVTGAGKAPLTLDFLAKHGFL